MTEASTWGAEPAQHRPYQEHAIDFLVKRNGRGMLLADTGAGKTYISLRVVSRLGYDRLVILARKYIHMLTWRNNIAKFRAQLSLPNDADVIFIEGWTAAKRRALWETEPERPQIIIMLFASMVRDRNLIDHPRARVSGFIIDEAHGVSDHRNQSSKALKFLVRNKSRIAIYLTATPMAKGRQNMFSFLNMLSPTVFTSYWKFVERYCVTIPGFKGNEILGDRKSTRDEYHQRISGFLHVIPSSALKGFVPERVRSVLPIPMIKGPELKAYRSILSDAIARLPSKGVVAYSNVLTTTLRARQMLVCPKLIDQKFSYGNGITEILNHAEGIEPNPHIVIFSEFVSAFPYITEHLIRDHKFQRQSVFNIVGGRSLDDTQRIADQFHQCHGKRSVLLCGIGVAESFDLLTPTNAYMLGYTYSRTANYQAEGRLTRGQKTHCNFFYVTHIDSVEESVLHIVSSNDKNVARAIDAVELRQSLLNPPEVVI